MKNNNNIRIVLTVAIVGAALVVLIKWPLIMIALGTISSACALGLALDVKAGAIRTLGDIEKGRDKWLGDHQRHTGHVTPGDGVESKRGSGRPGSQS